MAAKLWWKSCVPKRLRTVSPYVLLLALLSPSGSLSPAKPLDSDVLPLKHLKFTQISLFNYICHLELLRFSFFCSGWQEISFPESKTPYETGTKESLDKPPSAGALSTTYFCRWYLPLSLDSVNVQLRLGWPKLRRPSLGEMSPSLSMLAATCPVRGKRETFAFFRRLSCFQWRGNMKTNSQELKNAKKFRQALHNYWNYSCILNNNKYHSVNQGSTFFHCPVP